MNGPLGPGTTPGGPATGWIDTCHASEAWFHVGPPMKASSSTQVDHHIIPKRSMVLEYVPKFTPKVTQFCG